MKGAVTMNPTGLYDGDLEMFCEPPRELDLSKPRCLC